MERLKIMAEGAWDPVEAAIHMARYRIAAASCRAREGVRALDVACGEGYGSHLLKRFGAASVDGVDIAPEAVATARQLFAADGIRFHEADATRVDELFPPASFDLIVSIETIEHLREPRRFLKAIRKLAAPEAVIILTCPNDLWYYPDESAANPHHVRKYAFQEFQELAESVLGEAAHWGIGAPLIGFANLWDTAADADDGGSRLMRYAAAEAAVLPAAPDDRVDAEHCSYFIGIWGWREAPDVSAAFAPLSMDRFSDMQLCAQPDVQAAHVHRIRRERAGAEEKTAELDELRRELERQRVRANVLQRERTVLLTQVGELQRRAEELQAQIVQLTRSWPRRVMEGVYHRLPPPLARRAAALARRLRLI